MSPGKRTLVTLALLAAACAGLWLTKPLWKAGTAQVDTAQVDSGASLGIVVQDTEEGLWVLAVQEGSAAQALGILPGDMLTDANDMQLSTSAQLDSSLAEGCEHFTLNRRGQRIKVKLK